MEIDDWELTRLARGKMTQVEWANELGLTQSVISQYERGAVTPTTDVWLRMAECSGAPVNILIWRRLGFNETRVAEMHKQIIEGKGLELEEREFLIAKDQAKELLLQSGHFPEEVTLPQNPPAPESEKSKTVEEWLAKNNATIGEGQIAQEVKPKMPREKGKSKKKAKK